MLPDYPQALARALACLSDLDPSIPRLRTLTHALDARLAEPIHADRDQPPFDRATMDGYALRAADLAAPESRLRVVGSASAGAECTTTLAPGQAIRIATGAPLPRGADSVVRHEWTDRAEPVVTIRPPMPVPPGHCVHPRAADARAGAPLARTGDVVTPLIVAAAATVGVTRARVTGRPTLPSVAILTSGDEVVPPETPTDRLSPSQIRSSNGPLLAACIPFFAGAVTGTIHVPDTPAETLAAVRAALEDADILVTVGGVSAGERDRFPAAFEALDVAPALQGAAIQPGRPVYVGVARRAGCVVVGLPGNPVSVLACAHLFLWPIVRALAGRDPALPWTTARLAHAVQPSKDRRLFRPAAVDATGAATVPPWSGSGDLIHALPTHGLLELPAAGAPAQPGESLRFLPWAWSNAR